MARPIKYTKNLAEEIAQEIKQGVTPEVAAQIHGLGISTYYEWMSKGRDNIKPFTEFLESVSRARAQLRRFVERRILVNNPTFFAARSPLMRESQEMQGWHGFEHNDVNVQVVTISSIVDGARAALHAKGENLDILALPEVTDRINYIGDNGSTNNNRTSGEGKGLD